MAEPLKIKYIHNVNENEIADHVLGHPSDCHCEPVCYEREVIADEHRILIVVHQQLARKKKKPKGWARG